MITRDQQFYVNLITNLHSLEFDAGDIVDFLNADLGKELFSWGSNSLVTKIKMGDRVIIELQ